ncbi:hypothetical protein Ddc_04315 [Ditylenchus destructor]|nr:hypothetical protein Ddc_04315 [Ditylenchus destructor]
MATRILFPYLFTIGLIFAVHAQDNCDETFPKIGKCINGHCPGQYECNFSTYTCCVPTDKSSEENVSAEGHNVPLDEGKLVNLIRQLIAQSKKLLPKNNTQTS